LGLGHRHSYSIPYTLLLPFIIQLTVTSITQCLRPSQQANGRSPAKIVEGEEKTTEEEANDKQEGNEPLLAVKTVLLNRHPSDCSTKDDDAEKEAGKTVTN
jgi:hypothetical protein